jgi:5-methylcytosine-specific restriction endonuclease McrA
MRTSVRIDGYNVLMGRYAKGHKRKHRSHNKHYDPHYYTKAGPVTITMADGSTETKPALRETEFQKIVRVRRRITKGLRARIESRDRKCRYCGDTAGPFHVDHVVPIAMGGSNRNRNLVLACSSCNGRKGANAWIPKAAR